MRAISRKRSIRRKGGQVVFAVIALFILLVIFLPMLLR
jgi:hypothetical protein